MARKYKRRIKNFFIKENFQGRIILAFFLAVTLGCLFFITIFGFFSADTMTISYENSDLKFGQTPMMLFQKAIAANWIFLIICGTLLVIVAIIGSHRIAGPLYRFEKTLDSMMARDLADTIHLRGKDEGKDLAEKINRFNKALSEDIKLLNRRSSAVNDLINQYNSLSSSKLSVDEMNSICYAIKSNNDKIKEIIAAYQLADDR